MPHCTWVMFLIQLKPFPGCLIISYLTRTGLSLVKVAKPGTLGLIVWFESQPWYNVLTNQWSHRQIFMFHVILQTCSLCVDVCVTTTASASMIARALQDRAGHESGMATIDGCSTFIACHLEVWNVPVWYGVWHINNSIWQTPYSLSVLIKWQIINKSQRYRFMPRYATSFQYFPIVIK